MNSFELIADFIKNQGEMNDRLLAQIVDQQDILRKLVDINNRLAEALRNKEGKDG